MAQPPTGPTIDAAERRRRIGARHFLATRASADDPAGAIGAGDPAVPNVVATVADRLVGIHATDPASVYLGLRARILGLTRDSVGAALYDDRSVLKILGMRRTMFVVPPTLAAVVQAAVTNDLAAAQRKRLLRMLADAGIASDPESWLATVESQTVEALEELGEATAADLTKRVAGLREQMPVAIGKRYEATVGVSTRLLFLLSTESRIIRGRPKGTWLSSLYRWVPMNRWVEGGLDAWPADRARAELARRWLTAYAPGTLRDLQWWTGWTVANTRAALRDSGAIEVSILDDSGNRTSGYALPGDAEATSEGSSWVALLPGLDTTTMAWAERDFSLGPHARQLFDSNGNAGPTVWVDGRAVGLWAQRASNEVAVRLLEDVGREQEQAIEAEAAALTEWLGPYRVIPRFPNPLFRELAAS